MKMNNVPVFMNELRTTHRLKMECKLDMILKIIETYISMRGTKKAEGQRENMLIDRMTQAGMQSTTLSCPIKIGSVL